VSDERENQRLACPRCGYDLAGQADATRAANGGRLEGGGVCSECGLEFEWADVLDPWRTRVKGFVEHAERAEFAAVWRTWALALRPWVFWGRVRVEMALRPGRIVLWLILGPVLLWALGSLTAHVIGSTTPGPIRPPFVPSLAYYWIWPEEDLMYRRFSWSHDPVRSLPVAFTGPFAAGLLAPAVLLLLPDTRRLAKVRWVHVLRAAVYGMSWTVPVLGLRGACRAFLALHNLGLTRTRWSAAAMSSGWIQATEAIVGLAHGFWLLWLAVFMAWIMAWWLFALRVGWRVEEHRRVFWAMMVPAWLGAALALAVSEDGFGAFL
jgi:hypothetical protein